MPAVVADTHAIIWYLAKDPRLSARAREAFNRAAQERDVIHVPSVCLVEMTYLIEKGRLPRQARESLLFALDYPDMPCRIAVLDRQVAEALESVSRAEVPDFPDRIISATAVALGLPLVSRDRKIRASNVHTIW